MRRFFANAQNDWRGVSEILQMQNTHFQNDGVVVGDSKRTCVRKYRTSEWRTTHVTLRERIFVLRPKGLLACHSGIYFSSFLQFFLSFQRFLLSFTRFFVSYLWFSCHSLVFLLFLWFFLVIPAKAGIQKQFIYSDINKERVKDRLNSLIMRGFIQALIF